jgi:hypothetical protein
MYMYTYVYMDIYVYTISNKILYFGLSYVKLQNSTVLQLNLWQINPTSIVQTTQLRFDVRNTTFVHRYYYSSSFFIADN